MISNYEALQKFTPDEMALFLRMSASHIGGWAYQELIEWLSNPDNISDRVKDKQAKEFYELHG